MIDVDNINRAAPAPLDLARRLGMQVAPGARRDVVRVVCPWHQDEHPSCSLSVREGRLVAYCHACRSGGDLLALVAAVHGLDHRHDFRRVAELAAELVGVALESGRLTPARRARPAVDALAFRIDVSANDWLGGRDIRPDEDTEASAALLPDALELLRFADQIGREEQEQNEAALSAIAYAKEATWA